MHIPPQKAQLERPVDILVATPKGLWQHMEEGNLFIGDARFFVLDEADTMFDRGFGPEVAKILGPMKKKEPAASTVLVSATMTQRVQRLITEQIPQAKSIQTATLHK